MFVMRDTSKQTRAGGLFIKRGIEINYLNRNRSFLLLTVFSPRRRASV